MAERPPRRPSTSSLMSETHQRDSARLSNPDVFSDEYAMDSLQISDGFRPSGPNNGAHNREGPQTAPTDHSTEAHVQEHQDPAAASIRSYSSRASTYIERRSSLLSLLSRPDNHRQSSLSGTRASVHSYETPASAVFRSASRASTFTMPRAQSPYQGATGPSHPYGMYVQDTGVLRNPSTATASTVRPQERPYTGSTGPTQPYGMYPQDIVLEDEISPVRSPHRLVPVGFPGRTQNYRRQLGPSGEEADDLVGPDGYTEQLPPYTRWPDGIPPKGGGPGPASILSAERDDPGTSEENLANPFRSRDPLPQHQQSNPSSTNLTAVAASEPQQEDEGGNFKERVIEKGKKKLCFGRVPLWLIAILVIVMVAVLAGVIGAVVGRARGEKQAASTPTIVQRPSWAPAAPATVVTTITSLVDATPLPSTPADLPALPTGTFYVPLRDPILSNNSCLSSHVDAWDCSNGADLQLDLSDSQMVSVSPRFPPTAYQVRFGPQPPQLDQPVPLMLMGDKDGMERGPAWFFQQPYTKVVVVPGKVWDMDGAVTKRWSDILGGRRNRRHIDARGYGGIAPAAAKPWFCYWNNTILEGFIYVTQNSSGNAQPMPSDYPSPSSSAGDFELPTAGSSEDGDRPFPVFTPPLPPNPAVPTGSMHKRHIADPSQLLAYTKIVKIEERRDPDPALQPYCVHMQIMNDGSAHPLPEPIVTLVESEPDYDQSDHQSTRLRRRWEDLVERDSSTSACECEWVVS